MKHLLRFFWNFKFSFAMACLILFLCLRHATPDVFYLVRDNPVVLPEVDGGIFMVNLRDTIGHFGAYVCLAGLMVLETHKSNLSKLKKVLACILVPILFSGIVELLQEYCTYTRAAEWGDMLCNSCGTLTGFFLATLLPRILPKRFLKYFSKLF